MEKKNNIKINFVLNNLNLFIKLVFPIIIFPYISKIFQPEIKGMIDFSLSIVSYFIIISGLGIPVYGIREVARIKTDKKKLNKLIIELLLINMISTIFCIILYFICIYYSTKLSININIYLILSLNIIFSPLSIEWFYQGMEEYKYILLRNSIIQSISLILIFIFVKNKNDYIIYCWIIVFQTVGMNLFNFINLKKVINISEFQFEKIEFKNHLESIGITFIMRLASTIYVNLDTTMLGYLGNDVSVAFYTAGIKFNKILVAIGTSLSGVMIPKINKYLKAGEVDKINELNRITLDFIFFFSIPSIMCIYLFSSNIVNVFLGKEYLKVIKTMKLMSPIILFMGLSNFLGVQILYTNNQERKMMYSLIIGAITNLICNFIFIPLYLENGAALGTVVAEFSVFLIQYIFAKKYLNQKIINNNVIKFFIAGLFSLTIIKGLFIFSGKKNNLLEMIFYGLIYLVIYLLIVYITKTKRSEVIEFD